jgi:hypothetical protein
MNVMMKDLTLRTAAHRWTLRTAAHRCAPLRTAAHCR